MKYALALMSTAAVLLPSFESFAQQGIDTGRPEQEGEGSQAKLVEIHTTVALESVFGINWSGVADLGTVVSGEKYRIKIEIKNPTNGEMRFKGLTKNCSCFDSKLSSLVLPPEGSVFVELSAPVPLKLGKKEAAWRFSLDRATMSDANVMVRLDYSIAGLLEFLERRVVCESVASAGEEHFLVPLLFTKPVEAENLHFHFPESLGGVDGSVVEKDGKHYLQLTVNGSTLKTRYLAGEIGCVDTLTGREDSLYCVIQRSDGVSVHPGILRVVERDAPSQGGDSTAMIRIAARLPEMGGGANEQEKSIGDSIVEAWLGDELLVVKIERLSASSLRARIEFSDEQIVELKKAKRPEVRWNIRVNQAVFDVVSRVGLQMR